MTCSGHGGLLIWYFHSLVLVRKHYLCGDQLIVFTYIPHLTICPFLACEDPTSLF